MLTFYACPEFELRLLEPMCAEELFALVEAHRAYFARFQGWPDCMTTVEATRGFLRGAVHNFAECGALYLGIYVDGALAGGVGFNPGIDPVQHTAEMFYYIAEPWQGRGYVTRACRVLIDYGFRTMNLHRILVRAAGSNTRSWAVAERLGFTRDGVHRDAKWLGDRYDDHYFYSLLENEWMGYPLVETLTAQE
jgi:ribosomal-protein-serine acetyltransferase